MPRPDFITQDDLARWDSILEQDAPFLFIKEMTNIEVSSTLKEVCYAGQYLMEQLVQLNCPDEIILRINYTAGKMSFGRDPWEISFLLLDKFKNNQLILEDDSNAGNN